MMADRTLIVKHLSSGALWLADGTGLQASEARVGLGGFHGTHRPGDPPPLAVGALRVFLLLADLVRSGGRHRLRGGRSGAYARDERVHGPGGKWGPSRSTAARRARGRRHYATCGAGWTRGSFSGAAGARGRARPRRRNCKRYSTPWPTGGTLTSSSAVNKVPLAVSLGTVYTRTCSATTGLRGRLWKVRALLSFAAGRATKRSP